MKIYQNITVEKNNGSLVFANDKVHLAFDMDTGVLVDVAYEGKALTVGEKKSEVVLALDGKYVAYHVRNEGGAFMHPENPMIVDETRLVDWNVERGVGEVTLTLICDTTVGKLEKSYTLSSKEEKNVITRRFALHATRKLRIDEAALMLPKLNLTQNEEVSSFDAFLCRGENGAAMMWAGSFRDECSTVKVEDGYLTHRNYLCAKVESGETIRFGEDFIALETAENWMDAVSAAQRQHTRAGLICKNPMKDFDRIAIYEVTIGSWSNPNGPVEPYKRVADLVADLDRIRSLGFNVIQLMPSIPFPSYSAEDLTDLCLQNAGGEDITPLVKGLHERGMRLIMDIVLHGVLDADGLSLKMEESLEEIAKKTRRHVVHPLRTEHPDWFMYGDDGAMMRTYTWSFDHANGEWQNYLVEALASYVSKYDVDGFRFDALEWSQTPNCADGLPYRGGSHLRRGNYELYSKLRTRIDAIKKNILWMDENPHVYLADVMYACYGASTPVYLQDVHDGMRTATELQRFLALRDRYYPQGFSFVQYGENHDIVENKNSRNFLANEYGFPFAQLQITFGAMAGGPFMCFMTGEKGNEEVIRNDIALRDRFPELFVETKPNFERAICDDDAILCVSRKKGEREFVGVFNTGKADKDVTVKLDGAKMTGIWENAITGEKVDVSKLHLDGERYILLIK